MSATGTSLHSRRCNILAAIGVRADSAILAAAVIELRSSLNLPAAGARRHGSHRDLIARQLRDGSRLRLDGHLAVSLSNIARTVALNGIQDAVLDAGLNAGGKEENQTLARQGKSLRVL